jgi:hypothetical protein
MRAKMPGHLVIWAGTVAWGEMENGDLIAAAERNEYAVLITADQNIFYQQNNESRKIALIILNTNYWPAILEHMDKVNEAVARAVPQSFEVVDIPLLKASARK